MTEAALPAKWAERFAGVASVIEQTEVRHGPIVLRNLSFESGFYFSGRIGSRRDEAQPPADAKDVGIDGQAGQTKAYGNDNVGCFAPYTGQAEELVEIAGHTAAEVGDYHAGSGFEVAGFAIGIADGTDVSEDISYLSFSHSFRSAVGLEKGGRNKVDTLVGALCRENNCYKQLEGSFIVELRVGWGANRAEIVQCQTQTFSPFQLNFVYATLMAPAGKVCGEELLQNGLGIGCGDETARHYEDVGIVMLAGEVGYLCVPTKSSAHLRVFVEGDCHSLPCAANSDAHGALSTLHPLGKSVGEVGIVATLRGEGAVVKERDVLLGKTGFDKGL